MAEESDFKLDDSVTDRDLLFRIARELKTIRENTGKALFAIHAAEAEVPEALRRFMNYMHDIHDVKYMYEELGHKVPDHLNRELERCDDRYRQILKTLHSDGGALEKVRREMAEDTENRWDHKQQLTFRKSGS